MLTPAGLSDVTDADAQLSVSTISCHPVVVVVVVVEVKEEKERN